MVETSQLSSVYSVSLRFISLLNLEPWRALGLINQVKVDVIKTTTIIELTKMLLKKK